MQVTLLGGTNGELASLFLSLSLEILFNCYTLLSDTNIYFPTAHTHQQSN